MTIRHVVLFTYKPETPESVIAEAIGLLNALPKAIPEILDWAIIEDEGKRPGSYRFVLIASFDDLAAVDRYLDHPAHVAAVAFGGPHIAHFAEHDHAV
ncbi:Stress responsive A/B Barrel Domain [Kaistia soli DSM 19436]|uniref:Stress responsive A/B Barrel Domain n=1 Tax=Kaistia soli DSM 19436 TaxID=1122133 RepID=A0A1M4WJ05_9HYPH|nr:Dabb family protein [Kaistia soli]SHE81206.1 Stress responsive A/B Barrel Domain [Kaistia soli DSM 19436]